MTTPYSDMSLYSPCHYIVLSLYSAGIILINFSADFSDISDLRLVENCLKMTAFDVTGGNESKTVI